MSSPFGGHPTFQQYLEWARTEAGCEIKQGVIQDDEGRPFNITKIVAPSGKHVIEVGIQHTEFLVPTTIGRLDRRLGLTSPFFSIEADTGVAKTAH